MTFFIAGSKFFLTFVLILMAGCQPSIATASAIERSYEVIDTLPHTERPFTQGLVIDNGDFLESSGLYGKSYVIAYPLAPSENPVWQVPVRSDIFAEGLTVFDNQIYLLSWKRGLLKIYNRDSRQLVNTIGYSGEGWGLTHNGEQLIRSDGSHRLFFHDPQSFAISSTLEVYEGTQKITKLNELEYAEGFIWANIWMQNRLVAIDPETGQVVYSIDLTELVRQEGHTDPNWVLNGIAYDDSRNAYWVTGKRWRQLYLIKPGK